MVLHYLPKELLLPFNLLLERADLFSLALSNKVLFDTFQESLYSTVVLKDDDISGQSILAIADSIRASLVSMVQYSPRDPRDPKLSTASELSTPSDLSITPSELTTSYKLSQSSKEALTRLSCFIKLRRFHFNIEWDVKQLPDYLTDYQYRNWDDLLQDSFSALAESRGAFSQLQISGLPPYGDSDHSYNWLRSWRWQELLRGLESFAITLLGVTFEDDVELYSLTTTEPHDQFSNNLGRMFLYQLINVEHLQITGRPDGCLTTILNWEEVCMMPRLKSFEIEYAILDQVFTHFIIRHLPNLEKVYIRHCVHNDWKLLFEGIIAAKPKQLTDFSIQHFPTLRRALNQTRQQWRRAEKELRDGQNGMIEDDTRLRLFPRGFLGDYGFIQCPFDAVDDDDDDLAVAVTRELIDEGRATMRWKKLLRMVRGNRDVKTSARILSRDRTGVGRKRQGSLALPSPIKRGRVEESDGEM